MRSKLVLVVLLVALTARAADEQVVITVHEGEQQTFSGFGASLVDADYDSWPQTIKNQCVELFWKDLGANVLRVWVSRGSDANGVAGKCAGAVSAARAANPSFQLLLGPTVGTGAQAWISNPDAHASWIASVAKGLEDKGITVDATGIANEPNDGAIWNGNEEQSRQQMAACVKALGRELGNRGLDKVKIISPETSNVDHIGYQLTEAVIDDAEALEALDGFSTHSYGMCLTREMRDMVAPHGKEFWVTESGDNGPEGNDDDEKATVCASRLLDDINLGATHWVQFIAFSQRDDGDNATRIIWFDKGSGEVQPLLKFYYFKQILSCIRPGAVMRNATADLWDLADRMNDEMNTQGIDDVYKIWDDRFDNMEIQYGIKAPVYAAAGRNTDGTWGLSVTDLTGVCGPLDGDADCLPFLINTIPATSFDVTVHVEELAGARDVEFNIFRSNRAAQGEAEGTVTMSGGDVSFSIQPLECVSLISVEPLDAAVRPASAARRSAGTLAVKNGISGAATFGFDIRRPAGAGAVRLEIYDCSGAHVRTLVDGALAHGHHEVAWDGTAAAGGRAGAGTYVARLTAESTEVSAQVLMR
jgi:hypothetical protein